MGEVPVLMLLMRKDGLLAVYEQIRTTYSTAYLKQ